MSASNLPRWLQLSFNNLPANFGESVVGEFSVHSDAFPRLPFPASQNVLHTICMAIGIRFFWGGYTYQYPLHINSWGVRSPAYPRFRRPWALVGRPEALLRSSLTTRSGQKPARQEPVRGGQKPARKRSKTRCSREPFTVHSFSPTALPLQ